MTITISKDSLIERKRGEANPKFRNLTLSRRQQTTTGISAGKNMKIYLMLDIFTYSLRDNAIFVTFLYLFIPSFKVN